MIAAIDTGKLVELVWAAALAGVAVAASPASTSATSATSVLLGMASSLRAVGATARRQPCAAA
jgi:hypothetical protein